MKIYKDELPKNCGECPFNYDSVGCEVFVSETEEDRAELRRCLDAMYGDLIEDAITDRRFSKCPLETTQSLKQQVREEVVEEIKEKLKGKAIFHPEDEFEIDYNFFYEEDVEEILDQVKGESNVKD